MRQDKSTDQRLTAPSLNGTAKKEYTALKPVPSKRLGVGPGDGEGQAVGTLLQYSDWMIKVVK